jgi:putative ABC transport system permease protein
MVVILLLMRLVIWRERRESSLKKALGFTASDIRMDYMKKLTFYLLTGLALGIVSGMVSAQRLAGILLGFMGARGIKFTTDAVSVFVVVPVLMILTSFIAAFISLREIANIKAYECLTTRE